MKKIITGLLCAFLMLSFATMLVSADTEPNDDYSSAEVIVDGAYVSGTLDEYTDDADYYQIDLNEDDEISVSLTGTGDDFDLEMYGPGDYPSYLTASSDYGTSTESMTYTAYDSGYHYIVVEAYSGSGSYWLSVTVNEGDGGGTGGETPGDLWVGGDPYVSGDPKAEVPTPTVGDSVYWGGVKDIGQEFEDQLEEGLQEIEDMGFDVKYDINGGVGAYFGVEVASDSADVDGTTCYDYHFTGALAIDFGIDASVDGDIDLGDFGGTASIDGSGNGYLELEATLDGHLYLTVDELAIAKFTMTLTADGHGELSVDADYSMQTLRQTISADATMDVDGAQIDFDLTFDPPVDLYQFPMWEGKEWYVPGSDTDISGSLNAQGTISYDVHANVPGEEPVNEGETVNLADEIGDNDFFETVPGGQGDYWEMGGTMFTCAYAGGDIFIIETDLGNAFGYLDLGTRQFDTSSYEDMIPSPGMQYNGQTGMITGMTVDGEAMTSEVTAAEVDAFTADPLGEVADETGGHAADGAGIMGIILIGVIVIVVVIVVVVMMTRKKTPPVHQHPQQYGQAPPPPPPEYQPQQGYQQPQEYQPPPDHQQPPPPPPPGY